MAAASQQRAVLFNGRRSLRAERRLMPTLSLNTLHHYFYRSFVNAFSENLEKITGGNEKNANRTIVARTAPTRRPFRH